MFSVLQYIPHEQNIYTETIQISLSAHENSSRGLYLLIQHRTRSIGYDEFIIELKLSKYMITKKNTFCIADHIKCSFGGR